MKIVTDPVRPASELRKSTPPNVTAALAKGASRFLMIPDASRQSTNRVESVLVQGFLEERRLRGP